MGLLESSQTPIPPYRPKEMTRTDKKVPLIYRGRRIDSFPVAFDTAKRSVDGLQSPHYEWWLDVITGDGKQDETAKNSSQTSQDQIKSKGEVVNHENLSARILAANWISRNKAWSQPSLP